MTRVRVFWLRFAVTAGLLLLVFGLLQALWYPSAYFELFGVSKLYLTLAIAVLIVGPGLSTLVFRPGKKGLVLDLIIIGAIEIAIFSWAISVLYERQPVYAVFAVDRFEAVRADEVDLKQLEFSELAGRPGHAPRLVYAELPTDPDVMNRLIDETVFYGMADIDRRPEFWRPYAQGIRKLRTAALPLTTLLAGNDSRASLVQKWLNDQSLTASDFLYLPIKAGQADGTVILHADIGYPVTILAVDPW